MADLMGDGHSMKVGDRICQGLVKNVALALVPVTSVTTQVRGDCMVSRCKWGLAAWPHHTCREGCMVSLVVRSTQVGVVRMTKFGGRTWPCCCRCCRVACLACVIHFMQLPPYNHEDEGLLCGAS
jgi:hypothetical protein